MDVTIFYNEPSFLVRYFPKHNVLIIGCDINAHMGKYKNDKFCSHKSPYPTVRPQKVRLEEHRKVIVRGEIEKTGMADHILREKGNHLPLWDEVEIIDWAEHWRIRRLKESAHMLGYYELQSRSSIEMNTIWEPIIKKGYSAFPKVPPLLDPHNH